MGTYFVMESAACSSTEITARTERLSFSTKQNGYLIADQVYGSKQPGSAPLSWIGGSTPASRRMRAERAKPKRERQKPGREEYSRLEKQDPCSGLRVCRAKPGAWRAGVVHAQHVSERT